MVDFIAGATPEPLNSAVSIAEVVWYVATIFGGVMLWVIKEWLKRVTGKLDELKDSLVENMLQIGIVEQRLNDHIKQDEREHTILFERTRANAD